MRRVTQVLGMTSLLGGLFSPAQAALRNDCEQRKDADLSISACSNLIKSDPISSAYIARGNAYLAKRNYDRALADGISASNIDSKNPAAWRLRGLADIEKGDLPAAITFLTRAI